MAGLDLTAVEKAIESWAIDDLRIDRDGGVSDDPLDEETLLITPNPDQPVWSGKGGIQPLNGFIEAGDPDVTRLVEEKGARYRALLPLREAIPARLQDVLTVVALHSPSADPRLAGRRFVVVELGQVSSFAVTQVLYLRPLD